MPYSKTIQIKTPQGFLKFGCGFVVIGILLFIMAFVSYGNERDFAKAAQYATGTVINLAQAQVETKNQTMNGNSVSFQTDYFPTIRFKANGQDYTFTANDGSNPPEYQVGQVVNIMYDPQDPTNASINSWMDTWGAAVIFSILGFAFTSMGIMFISCRNKIKAQMLAKGN